MPTKEIITPVVGMGVTQCFISDRHAFTIIEVSKNKIVVQEDTATKVENYDYYSNQHFTYSPNPDGRKITLTLRRDGVWREDGTKKNCGQHWQLNMRRQYQDPSF